MSSFSLACYTIRVNKTSSEDKSVKSLMLDGSSGGLDLMIFVKDFFDRMHEKQIVDPDNKTVMKVSHSSTPSPSRIVGIVEGGNYGLSSNLVHNKTGATVHSRAKDQAELLPFYFHLFIPEKANEAILILSRVDNKGIRKDLEKVIIKTFGQKNQDCEIKIAPLICDAIIENYLKNGQIKSLRFIKFNISHDLVDSLDEGHQEIQISREITYHVKDRKQYLPMKTEIFSNFFKTPKKERKVQSLLELKETDGEYDTIKVDVEIGGSHKTIDLGNFKRVRSYFDITKDPLLEIDPNGHPTFDSIDKIADLLCRDMIAIMYA